MSYIRSGTVNIWTEIFGEPSNPALLIIIGAGVISTLFPDYFCQQLAASGLFVMLFNTKLWDLIAEQCLLHI